MERKRRRHVIGDFREKAPFYGLFEKIWKEAGGVFFDVQNYAGGWLEFRFLAQALPGELVV